MRSLRLTLAAVLLALPLSGCGDRVDLLGPCPEEYACVNGTVGWMHLEGGFWAITGDDHVTYDPINLPPEFRQDGLRVHVRARVRNDLGSIHMVGPIVEIVTIRRL